MNYIYLDNAATTKPNAEILQSSFEYFNKDGYFNPSALYKPARAVKNAIESVRSNLLSLFPSGYDAIFTSGGTEADNLALFSFAKRGNIVTSQGEHSAINNTFNQLKQQGVETRFAKLNKDGSVNEEHLLSLIDDKTTFVSIVHVNNETGAINDINAIAKRIKLKNKSIIFHSDGVQAFFKIPYRLSNDIDAYSVSAHKICALKGVGALIYKKSLSVKAMIYGGGQEKNLRSGTENTFGIFVFGKVIESLKGKIVENYNNAHALNGILRSKLEEVAEFLTDKNNVSPYILSLSFPGIKAEILQRVLEDEGVIVGTGSACSSKLGTSRIINACGLDKRTGEGVIRLSLIYTTTEEEINQSAKVIIECVQKLRKALK